MIARILGIIGLATSVVVVVIIIEKLHGLVQKNRQIVANTITEDLTMEKKLIVKTEMSEATHPVTVDTRRDLKDAYDSLKEKRDNGESITLADVEDVLFYTSKLLINITSIKKS